MNLIRKKKLKSGLKSFEKSNIMYFIEKMKAKLHGGCVTGANINYEGSVTIGKDLLKASGMNIFDRVQVLNVTNGNRIETYIIEGEDKEICLNGAAAHQFSVGDKVIIISYLFVDNVTQHYPIIIILNDDNSIKEKIRTLPLDEEVQEPFNICGIDFMDFPIPFEKKITPVKNE